MKNVYFISDAHLGSWAIEHRRMQERRLVRFLDDIKDKAQAVYMLGDMFDYWYEYKYVVPKGYTRFLGKVSELTDSGVEVHYFIGNHDIWMYGYLERECGVILHKEPVTLEIMGKEFFLAHGDGLGDPSRSFRFMRRIFRNRLCQFLFSLLPTCWSMPLGMSWAKKSMEDHRLSGVDKYLGEDEEFQVVYAKEYLSHIQT
jgi:UDP-2,3-diacylglucosamine hydrolase